MSRPKKKEISLNKESVLSLMQEIYNELVEQRATALRIQNKMLALMKDSSDMAIIGPIIKEQQKNNEENFSMSDIDDALIQDLLKKDISDEGSGGYKLNK